MNIQRNLPFAAGFSMASTCANAASLTSVIVQLKLGMPGNCPFNNRWIVATDSFTSPPKCGLTHSYIYLKNIYIFTQHQLNYEIQNEI